MLADDDMDDYIFFKNALTQMPVATNLTLAQDGEQLMYFLTHNQQLPDVLFLDINMPRKNGFECLAEIKQNIDLVHLPVIIMSTSVEPDVVSRLYNDGAKYFIRKPAEFSRFKEIILHTLLLIKQGPITQREMKDFVLMLPNEHVA